MSEVPALIQAQLYAAAIRGLTGVSPVVTQNDAGYAEISFTKEGALSIREFLEKRLSKMGGDQKVKLNMTPIIGPMALKRLFPWAVGIFAAGYLFSVMTKIK